MKIDIYKHIRIITNAVACALLTVVVLFLGCTAMSFMYFILEKLGIVTEAVYFTVMMIIVYIIAFYVYRDE
jgi:drug/metabolite transporter (DMT)-like permease